MSDLVAVERRFTSRAPELREAGGAKHIVGYASVFGKRSRNLGGFVEQVDIRAFDSAMLDGWQEVVCRYNHNDDFLLGTTAARTLELTVDSTGLLYDVIPPSFRSDIVELCARGDVSRSSFAFRTRNNGDDWEKRGPGGMPLRTLLDLDLIDTAPVINPAYLDATASARSFDEGLVMSIARYVHGDPTEVRNLLVNEDGSVAKFFKRSDRPSAPKAEEPDMTTSAAGETREETSDEDRAKLTSKERDALPDSAFAYIDAEGTGHFPIHDANHVRNALARIAQGAEYGKEALPKVKAAAKRFGIKTDEQNNIVDLVEELRDSVPDWLREEMRVLDVADEAPAEEASADETAEDRDTTPKAPGGTHTAAPKGSAEVQDDDSDDDSDDKADDDSDDKRNAVADALRPKNVLRDKYAQLMANRYDPYQFDGD